MWDKIALENLIYARAAAQNKQLWTRGGRLICSNCAGLLSDLLRVYNRFFARENRRFLAREQTCQLAQERAARQQFLQERELKPLASGYSLPLKNPLPGKGF